MMKTTPPTTQASAYDDNEVVNLTDNAHMNDLLLIGQKLLEDGDGLGRQRGLELGAEHKRSGGDAKVVHPGS